MYKILFTSALSLELKTVQNSIKLLNLKWIKTSFLNIWVWNYETILNLSNFLNKNNDFDFIINIWVCGYFWENIPDFFQVWRILNLSNKKEIIPPCFFSFWKLKTITCSEKPIFNFEDLDWENFVDMESFWFEFVLWKTKTPRIILKIPVDKIWEETRNFDKNKALKFLWEKINYENLIFSIKNYLEKNPKKEDFNKYFLHFNFTFSEKIIFEKLYFKYKTLVWNNFISFFKENKDLNKKNFLEKMDNICEKYI